MNSLLEYDFGVKRLIPASLALFALPLFLAARGYAQFNTSGAPVGHIVTGTAPSVTGPVHPPTGPVRPPTGTGPGIGSGILGPRLGGEHRHRRHADVGPLWYAIPVPYAVDLGPAEDQADSATADDQDGNYQGGPTVFDRRGSGADSYVPPVEDAASAHSSGHFSSERVDDPDPDPAPPQPTLLVFKDGHKLEVINYAIIGQTLFDMTPGHARRVPLTDLDLDATRQQNEDRGLTFQLPMSSQAN